METRNIHQGDQRYGYPGVCQNTYLNRVTANGSYFGSESVESVRTKPQYIQVGSKRRQVFNPFWRYRFQITPTTDVMDWCAGGTKNLSSQHWPMQPLRWYCQSYDNSFWSTNGSGDLPYMGDYRMMKLGEELRDFVIRDLFIKATEPRFQGAVFLAELTETLASIHLLLGGVAKSLFRHGKALGYAKHFALNPEELWLWWRYALMPAMLDVENLIKASKTQDQINRVQDGDRSDNWIHSTGTAYYHGWWSTGEKLPMKWKSKHRYGLGGAIDISKRVDPHEWGDSGWDVVQAAWEIIPFSFIADWFINVGDWLASLRSLEIEYAQSYCTYAIESQTKTVNNPEEGVYVTTEVTSTDFLMERIINLEPPPNPLIDRQWGKTLRYIDLISLTVAILKGIVKRRK